ncbi:MAG: type 1 glutamine amidotransferase [Sphingomonas bacterium]|nr:type 1 glutamine amidotransferase [Sphingomonas bacterium]
MKDLDGKHLLVMATDRFEESELFGPRAMLLERGATVTLASLAMEEIVGTVHDEPGRTITPDMLIGDVNLGEYDALLLPGGVGNPDRLRGETQAVALIRAFVDAGKPVAAICHAPWLLVEADVIRGKRVTSWPSIRTDLRNAGADVVNEAAVVDGNIITSRNPDDVPAFTEALANALLSPRPGSRPA